MVPIWFFALLGIIQGILEWLPVSSEGQIIFAGSIFGITDQSLLLSIAFWLHFGTMISVLVYYRIEWLEIFNVFNNDGKFLRKFLVITTIGTAITGIPLKLFILELIGAEDFGFWLMVLLAIALVITGFILKFQRSILDGSRELLGLSEKEMLAIGMAQGFTIIPGVSRSGTTVTALLFTNINSEDSFRGSFFMSVPAVLGAITLDLIDYIRGESVSIVSVDPLGVFIAIIFATTFGLITMSILIKVAREIDFSNLVLILAILVIIYIFFLI